MPCEDERREIETQNSGGRNDVRAVSAGEAMTIVGCCQFYGISGLSPF